MEGKLIDVDFSEFANTSGLDITIRLTGQQVIDLSGLKIGSTIKIEITKVYQESEDKK